jgi:ArsR family transcriptional regulator, arsenate/arsenite/antimonite-responsive transcriptional repressor
VDERQALAAFAALAQETRLQIVRRLVTAGPEGMASGALAEAAGVSASNVSFHLKELAQAGLATTRREARSIIYVADYAAFSGLIAFLMKDCCQGRPEVCTTAMRALAAGCGAPLESRA